MIDAPIPDCFDKEKMSKLSRIENPQKVIESTEFYTASLDERLEAAAQCVDAGYRVAFHFDPIIYSKTWEKDYEELVNIIPNSRIIDEKPLTHKNNCIIIWGD